MKYLLTVALLVAAVAGKDLYDNKNDDLDIEAVVSDPTTIKAFADCFSDKGECTELTADFKKDLKEAFEQACAKCTEAQKHLLKRFLETLEEKYPVEFGNLKQKYDPNSLYLAALKSAISNS